MDTRSSFQARHDSVPPMTHAIRGDTENAPVPVDHERSPLAAMLAVSVAVHFAIGAAAFGRALVDFASPPAAAATPISLQSDVTEDVPADAIPIDTAELEAPEDVAAPEPSPPRTPIPAPHRPVNEADNQTTAAADNDESPARAPSLLVDEDPYGDSEPFVTTEGSGAGFGLAKSNGTGSGRGRAPARSAPTPEPQRPVGPFSLGDVDEAPVPLATGEPLYPRAAERRRSEGSVRLRMLIDARGHVTSATVTSASGHHSFGPAAVNAARRWRFEPARRRGKAVAVWATQTLSFKLPKR